MPTLQQVVDAFARSARLYDIGGSGEGYIAQADLLPISFVAADHLLGVMAPGRAAEAFLCASGMLDEGDRQWCVEALRNARHHPENNMVDICALRGPTDPYEILLTMESEGWPGNGAALAADGSTENDALWDLYKLLHFPSPCRVFVTLMPDKHHDLLLGVTSQRAAAYEPTVAPGDLFAVQIPTANLRRHKVLVARWQKGAWSRTPDKELVALV
jgi:hypothetical protein